jgi:cell division protein FtsA
MLKYGNTETVAAVDIGTSKICVIIGEADSSKNIIVLGHGERPSDDVVCKGEISDMEKAAFLFQEALSDAEDSAGVEIGSDNIYVGVSGNHITAYKGVGSVPIPSDERVVNEDHINKALQNAQVVSHPPEERIIDAIGGHYVIDGRHRCENPLNQAAHKLEVHSHIICGNRNRIETFLTPLRDVGLDAATPVFSGIGSAYSVVSDEEHKKGTLFIDMGAGTTEFIVFYNPGISYSEVLSVGCDHIANDLSIALELPFSPVCRELVVSSTKPGGSEKSFIEIPGALGPRKIPEHTVSKVVEMRLRETFEVIKEKLAYHELLNGIGSGIVFTGGGSMIPAAEEILKDVFKLPVRIAGNKMPDNFGGAVSDLESPRYTALLGLLHFGIMSSNKGSIMTKLDRNINSFLKNTLQNTLKALKF